MNIKTSISLISVTVILMTMINFSCKYNSFEGRFEKALFQKVKDTEGFVWFKYSNTSLPKSNGSGHEQPFLKTRYNTIAATMLDSVGLVKPGSIFPEGSIVVKELLDGNGKLEVYAMLYKKSSHPSADERGWVWGEYYPDGTVKIASTLKGKDCNGCHSQSGNEDYMLMNKCFP